MKSFHKNILTVLIMLSLIAIFPVASASDAQMLAIGSDAYESMDMIYALAGKGTPSNSRPWSFAEARIILSRIDRSSLSPAGMALYDSMENEIGSYPRWSLGEDFHFSAGLTFNPEIYAHANTAFNQENDWIRGFEDREHAIEADLEMDIGDFFYTYCDLMYGYGRYGASDEDAGNYIRTDEYLSQLAAADPDGVYDLSMIGTVDGLSNMFSSKAAYFHTVPFLFNFPDKSANFDFQWPKRAILHLGGKNWNIGVGRDRLDWGNSHIGNMVIDDHVDYHDYFRLEAFTDRFKYDFLTLFFETANSNSEQKTQNVKMLLAHRLEFRFYHWLTFSISENVMYQTDIMDFGFLNPAMIYHNLNNRSMFNAIAHAELDIQLARGINIYGQFCLDQAKAPNEDESQQGAWGLLGGMELTCDLGSCILNSSLECAYTTPMLYRRDGVDFLMMMRTFSLWTVSYITTFDYIGFPYGGDSVVADWSNALVIPGICKLGLNLRASFHGEMTIYQSHNSGGDNTDMTNRQLKALSGNKLLQVYSASLFADTCLNDWIGGFAWPEIDSWLQADYIQKVEYQKDSSIASNLGADFQLTAGFGISF